MPSVAACAWIVIAPGNETFTLEQGQGCLVLAWTEQKIMAEPIGHLVWAIAEGYILPSSTGTGRQLTSHETVCILNTGDIEGEVEITVYFAEREPAGPYRLKVPPRRTRPISASTARSSEWLTVIYTN